MTTDWTADPGFTVDSGLYLADGSLAANFAIANTVVVGMILINPVTGSPYRVGQPDTPSVLPIPNAVALGCTLINPFTGAPYH